MSFRSIKLHPLLFAVGCIFILLGQGVLFLIYMLTVLFHEWAHSFCAARLGVSFGNCVLFPFGGAVNGNLTSVRPKDEVMIALAGPLANILVVIVLFALWWVFPAIYPFTEAFAFSNLATAIVNFLPAYPLDGGRVVFAICSEKIGRKRTMLFLRSLGVAFASIFLFSFFFTLSTRLNVTLLMMGGFLLVGAFFDLRGDYCKEELFTRTLTAKIANGLSVERVMLLETATILDAMRNLKKGVFIEFSVVDQNFESRGTFTQNDLFWRAGEMRPTESILKVLESVKKQSKQTICEKKC